MIGTGTAATAAGALLPGMPQLAFLAPDRLLLLLVIPLLIAAYIFASRRKNRRGMRFTNTSMLAVVVPKQSQWRRHLAVALSLLSLVTLTAAFARPKTVVDVPRERATVVVVIDASLSMQATDVKPSRLDAAKAAAVQFVRDLPEKFNVSVVSMAGSASILVPPTLAHDTVANAILGIRLQDSTAIGEGIATAMRALEQAPKDPSKPTSVAPGAIVLLSDGTNTVGRAPQQAAAEARNAKVPVYTIAYGTENGYVDLDGKRELVPVDHEQMQQVATISGGEYFRAASADQLQQVYENVRSEVGYVKADREVTSRFAGYGLAFAVLAALGAISLGARWP
ncbi:MAG TPA: VWA domain-containing protein [Propionibacteriaceae bacterium]|nr:VWA domain-containing protein [Propionibacteriaceae bacterium]